MHAVKRGQVEPVFVDVRAHALNIDPHNIEAAITPRTSAILAVRCYGNPYAVDEIETVACRNGLKVIGQQGAELSYGPRDLIELADIYFFRHPLRTRGWRTFH